MFRGLLRITLDILLKDIRFRVQLTKGDNDDSKI